MTTRLTFSDDTICRSAGASSVSREEIDAIMPGYSDYVDQLTPEQFIKMFWNDASDDMRGHMIDYINEHPFDGSLRYVAEWIDNLKRTYGQLN